MWLDLYVCEYFACMYVYVHQVHEVSGEARRGGSKPLKMETQEFVSCCTGAGSCTQVLSSILSVYEQPLPLTTQPSLTGTKLS